MTDKTMTVAEFAQKCGSVEAAAGMAGVSFYTYRRWMSTGTRPQNGNNARRLRELGVEVPIIAKITDEEWAAIKKATEHRCHYCRKRKPLTMDHKMPLNRGGQHTAENIAAACLPCNTAKGRKTESEFRAFVPKKRSRVGLRRPVEQFSPDGKTKINTFSSIRDAAKAAGCVDANIASACHGRVRLARGCVWKFAKISAKGTPIK